METIDRNLARNLGITEEQIAESDRRTFDAIPKTEDFAKAEADLAKLQEKEAALEAKRQAALALGQEYASRKSVVDRERRNLGIVHEKLTIHRQAAANREAVEILLADNYHHWSYVGNALLNLDNQRRIVELMEAETNRMNEALVLKQAELDAFAKEHGIVVEDKP